ncbi:carbohydrate porin [Sphingomonas abietis]|uniref:Carbohydrate porin n=1 Tax=Sphingomonas abietis TaxID=3012344 RepID=A0ABY7NJ16_9SPHN|nr:carbohydrate porin [Sphingomonas abietis]WBO21318.1 carbohydrate porin [Sphingomonas abietis]
MPHTLHAPRARAAAMAKRMTDAARAFPLACRMPAAVRWRPFLVGGSVLVSWSATASASVAETVATNPPGIDDATPPAAVPPADRQPARFDIRSARKRLEDDGFKFQLNYTSEVAGNLTGGAHRDTTEAGQFVFGATVDTDKAFGWKGGTFQFTISRRRGVNLSDKAGLDTLFAPQEVYGRGSTFRLTEFYLRQNFGIVDVEAGRLTMSELFGTLPCEFENLSFCGNQPGDMVGDYWYNYPIGQWGAWAKIHPGSVYLAVGAYAYNPNDLKRGIALSHGGTQGVTTPVEFGWTPRLGPSGLPGLYRIGAWYSTAHGDDVLDGEDGRPIGISGLPAERRSGRYGGYVLLTQQLTGRFTIDANGTAHTTQGLKIQANFTQMDRRTARLNSQLALWTTFVGPIKARPLDEIGFAIGRNGLNRRATEETALETPGTKRPRAEYPMELFYAVRLAPWLSVSPNVQYIVDPGGYEQARNVAVLGLKTGLSL